MCIIICLQKDISNYKILEIENISVLPGARDGEGVVGGEAGMAIKEQYEGSLW